MPLPSRAERLQASTKQMENLYYRHAANDNSLPGQRNTTFPDIPPRVSKGQRAPPGASDGGVPLSKAALEGGVPQVKDPRQAPYGRFAAPQNGPVDARNLGVRSDMRSGNDRFTMGRSGPVDARNLAAKPESVQAPLKISTANPVPNKLRANTIGLEEKQRYPPRLQTNARPLGQDKYQSREPRSGGGYAPRQVDASSDRPRRPRPSRSGEAGEPRRRKRDKQAGARSDFGSGKAFNEIWNEEEEEYLEEKRTREAAKSLNYQPTDVNRDMLNGLGPAVVSGEWGMSELLGERLTLANAHLQGSFIEWQSKEQKADVMTLVERLKGIKKGAPNKPLSLEASTPSAEAEQQTQKLLQKLLGGSYKFTEPQQGEDILGNVARHTDRNESYFPDDQKSLLEKVRSLMPTDQGRTNGKRTKPKART